MNALKTAGRTNESAVAQAEANRLVVESAVLRLQSQIKEVENSLSVLLGMVPQSIDRTSLDEQNFPSEPASGVPLQLLSNRPDIQQAEYTLAQFFYATNEARAAFYPGISLNGSAGWTNNAGGKIFLSAARRIKILFIKKNEPHNKKESGRICFFAEKCIFTRSIDREDYG